MATKTFLQVLLPAAALAAAGCFHATGTEEDAGTGSSSSGSATSSSGGSSGGSTSGSTSGGTGSSTGGASGGTDAGVGVGTACTRRKDPCPAVGLVCQIQGLGGGSCQLPSAGQGCLPAVGCAPGSSCLQDRIGATCRQDCTTTSDCTALAETCATGADGTTVCRPNACGPDAGNGNVADLFGTCNVDDGGTGTCLPPVPAGGGLPSLDGGNGVCYAGGTAPLGGPCSSTRTGPGSANLCPVESYCIQNPLDGNSACLPFCSLPGADAGSPPDAGGDLDGGTTAGVCPAGDICINPPTGLGGGARLGVGVCLTPCGSGNACPGGQTCQSLTPIGLPGSFCIP